MDGLTVHDDPDTVECYCQTTEDSNIFAIASEVVPLVLHGILKMDLDYNMKLSLWIPFTMGILVLIFGTLYATGLKFDNMEQELVKPLLCIDIRKRERYIYILVIRTGSKYDSGTTSNIGFKIYGVLGNSKVRFSYSEFLGYTSQLTSAPNPRSF